MPDVVDNAALRDAVRSYARSIASSYELGDALYSVTDRSLQILGCDGAGVSIADTEGDLRFVTATEQAVVRVEEEQAYAQEGPCYEAYATGTMVTTSDLGHETRWERYRKTTLDAGFRAVVGVPLLVEDQRIGAMNLYRRDVHEWSEEELDLAKLLGDMASGYIVNHRTLSASRQLADQLQEALESRVVVEQAKGVIAAHHDISVTEAFDRLRRYARQHGTRLHAVAQDVVERRMTP